MLLRQRRDVFAAGVASLGAMVAVAWPLWLQGMIMAVYTWADQVLLAGLRSTELAGVYGPVATLSPLFGVGLGALSGAFAPLIAEKHKAGDIAGLAAMYRLVTRWAVVLSLPAVVVCLAAPEAVLRLWPHGSTEAATALRIVCLAQLFGTAVGAVNYLLIMAGRPRAVLVNGVPAMIANLVLSFVLIPSMGVTGAALAAAAAAICANGIGLWQVWHHIGIHPFDRAFVRPLLAAVPAVVVAWLARGLDPIWAVGVGGVVGGLVFLVALRLLGFDAGDRQVIDTFARKLRR
jgi:O-antigen/teichoic acid export membrane protein